MTVDLMTCRVEQPVEGEFETKNTVTVGKNSRHFAG